MIRVQEKLTKLCMESRKKENAEHIDVTAVTSCRTESSTKLIGQIRQVDKSFDQSEAVNTQLNK